MNTIVKNTWGVATNALPVLYLRTVTAWLYNYISTDFERLSMPSSCKFLIDKCMHAYPLMHTFTCMRKTNIYQLNDWEFIDDNYNYDTQS